MPLERIVGFGAEDDPTKFNMAHMGLRLAQRANGVSLLHGQVSRGMFNDLWKGFDQDEVPIGSITNGVHAPTWAAPQWVELARELVGEDLGSLSEADTWQRLQQVDPGHLWWIRSQLRELLIADVRRRLRRSWLERGASEAELGWIASAFDPGVLTVGFARRVPTYKRLTLMLRDPDRLEKLLLDDERPVQLIVAGKSHPADDGGKALIQQIVRFADRPAVRHRIAFLPDYDMSMARYLYWGCDVWLNNPLRPLEACGTSGMKSALNGGLNLSIRDGWWDEWYDGENGWEIPTADGLADEARRDDLEATALYDLLEKSVTTSFYERDEHGVPQRWVEMVRHTLQVLGPKVLASRMVRDYTEKYYAPAAQSLHRTIEEVDGVPFGAAIDLANYCERARSSWPTVQITDVDSYGLPDTPLLGSELTLTATVHLGELQPDEVVVQAVVGRVDAGDALLDPVTVQMTHTGSADGNELFSIDDSAARRRSGRVHRAGAAASPAVGRGQRAGSRRTRVSRIFEVAVDGGPYALAAGSDGAMWVTLVHRGAIARVSAPGDLEVYPVADDCRPTIITAGPDGALWFTRAGDDRIGRISTAGQLDAFDLRAGSAPCGITVGPDGALWFAAMGTGVIGRIGLDGVVTEEAAPGGRPSMITTGPDNALWFTLNQANAIGRLDRGAVTLRKVPTPGAGPVGIAGTHDDAVWFTAILADKVGRIPMDEALQELDLPGKPHAVVADPAGGVWVSLWGADQIARVHADGDVATIDLPAGSEPHGMAIGPDGALWVALEAGFVMRLPTV